MLGTVTGSQCAGREKDRDHVQSAERAAAVSVFFFLPYSNGEESAGAGSVPMKCCQSPRLLGKRVLSKVTEAASSSPAPGEQQRGRDRAHTPPGEQLLCAHPPGINWDLLLFKSHRETNYPQMCGPVLAML